MPLEGSKEVSCSQIEEGNVTTEAAQYFIYCRSRRLEVPLKRSLRQLNAQWSKQRYPAICTLLYVLLDVVVGQGF